MIRGMVKGRYYKVEWWSPIKNKYIESLVAPIEITLKQRLNYVDCKILVGKGEGTTVSINVGQSSRVTHEYFSFDAMMKENAEFFI